MHLSPGPPPHVWDPLHILNWSSWYSLQVDSSCNFSHLTNSSSVLSLLRQKLGTTLDSSLVLAPQILFIHYWLYLQKMSRSELFTCFHPHLLAQGGLISELKHRGKPSIGRWAAVPAAVSPVPVGVLRTATGAILRPHEMRHLSVLCWLPCFLQRTASHPEAALRPHMAQSSVPRWPACIPWKPWRILSLDICLAGTFSSITSSFRFHILYEASSKFHPF